ncbi:phosphoenolpyruvate--protein phosphotransferase [Halobaculum lipolyticum]|uniref:Phosphoenolpyruvate--protein phosphotransferase n=1 Tax=Halobaculum lipolyticum TaxID=3032001 RepID=A0ABD5WJX9_9EURY|nr:putative PEP-binding protein [Halobaculum sp. DT31]
MSDELGGTSATPFSGVGTAVWYEAGVDLPEPPDPDDVDPAAERERVAATREEAREQLRTERDRTAERVGAAEAAIFEAHEGFLDDPRIADWIDDAIDDGLPAPHAVDRAYADAAAELEAAGGRTAERADDLRDLRDRLVGILLDAAAARLDDLPGGTVLLAERLSPSDTAGLDPEVVAGLATVTGGATSHAAIVARSLGIPAVVGVGEALRAVEAGATVGVDGGAGTVFVDPDDATRERLAGGDAVAVIDRAVATADGRPVEVVANVGGPGDVDRAVERGSDGVGLFRSEFLFQGRERPPDEDEQYAAYREAAAAFPDGRVVVRTLDVGGDKPLPYLDAPEERDPFLGVRGVRRSLGPDADLFETQLRALCRAAADGDGDGDRDADSDGDRDSDVGDLAVMIPMVATVEELDAALARLDSVADDLADEGVAHAVPETGVMIETPSAAFVAGALAERVSFLSVGTNDLTQYVMAASRENAGVADLNHPTHPGVVRAVARTAEAGHDAGARVAMCGEAAGDPRLAPLLVGLGIDEFSAAPPSVPRVKAAIEDVDAAAAERLAERALAAETRAEVEAVLDGDG